MDFLGWLNFMLLSTLGAADIIVIKQSDQECGYHGPVGECYDTSVSVP